MRRSPVPEPSNPETSLSEPSVVESPEAEISNPRFHGGLAQGLTSVLAAATVIGSILTSSWSDPIAPRLSILSFAIFCVALALGSSRIVGLTSFGVLGSALIASALSESSTWIESIFIGCLWYVAVELAWDSIDRRDGAVRSVSYNMRRVQELSSVVVVCLGVAWIAFAATELGPSRTLVGRGVFLVLALAGLWVALGHIASTAPKSPSDP